MVARENVTLEGFKEFVSRDENVGRLFELINGEIVEVMPGRTSNSQIHGIITATVRPFCKAHGIPCYTANADGAFNVQGNAVAPDFAYKQTPMSNDYPDPIAPIWAVEIISPTDKVADIRKKREIYRSAQILLWEVYPDERSIDVYVPGESLRTYGIEETIDLDNVIPGFSLSVRELFDI
ncbi:MAG: Uma2 family endonuclease [Chloroflexota bacterium]